MSLVLDAWIKACSPAIGLDQLVLLHVSDELQTPNGATVQDSVPSGRLIDPSNQHQNVHRRTGGGYRSMRDLGVRIWQDSRETAAEWNAGARIRRLRGLPNPGEQAYFPALLWTVQGGRYQDEFTGQVLNRREVWRIPLVLEAVLIRVPASVPAARKEKWTPEKGWKDAEDALFGARLRRAVTKVGDVAAAEARAAAVRRGCVSKTADREARLAREDAEKAAETAWDNCGEREQVREYLAYWRAIQEDQAWGDIDTGEVRPSTIVPGAYVGGGAEHAAALASIGERAAAGASSTSQQSLGTLPGAMATDEEQPSFWDEEPPPPWDESEEATPASGWDSDPEAA